jgi:hypothetical protein
LDAAINKVTRRTGGGIIARDAGGAVVAVQCASRPHITNLATVEAMATWMLVEFNLRLGYNQIIAEGDSMGVVGHCDVMGSVMAVMDISWMKLRHCSIKWSHGRFNTWVEKTTLLHTTWRNMLLQGRRNKYGFQTFQNCFTLNVNFDLDMS